MDFDKRKLLKNLLFSGVGLIFDTSALAREEENIEDGAVERALRHFLKDVPELTKQNPTLRSMNEPLPAFTPLDTALAQQFKTIFIDALARERYMRNIPFSRENFEKILHDTFKVYFSKCKSDVFEGYVNHVKQQMVICTNVSPDDYREYITVHEFLHLLGLGEELAHLLTRKILRRSELYNADDWVNFSGFAELLLERTDKQMFWAAAVDSNAAYGKVWDAQFGEIVSFRDMQQARALTRWYKKQPRANDTNYDSYKQLYEKDFGVRPGGMKQKFQQMYALFRRLVANADSMSADQFVSNSAAMSADQKKFSDFINLSRAAARTFAIPPTLAVFDHFIKTRDAQLMSALRHPSLSQRVGNCLKITPPISLGKIM